MRGVDRQASPPNLAFCVSARTGLGHLRRVTNIAAAVRRIAPRSRIDLLANAPLAGLSDAERAIFSRTFLVQRTVMARHLANEPPDVVAVDTAVIPDLELLAQPLALVLRETMPERLAAFRLAGARPWDHVIVAEPPAGWTLDPPSVGTRRVTNVGWIYRAADRGRAIIRRGPDDRVLLIASGGGGTSDTLAAEIGSIVRGVRAHVAAPLRVIQVLGPRAPRNAVVAGIDGIVEVGADLDMAFAEADVVISTSGYNSILELAATTTPAVLCALSRTYDDQAARAEVWADALGLAHQPGNADRSALWIADVLACGRRRPQAPLGRSGADGAARILVDLAEAGHDPERKLFAKSPKAVAAGAVAARARTLFGAGVPTPQALAPIRSDRIAFAHLAGPTARDDWQAAMSAATLDGAHAHALDELAAAIVAPLIALHAAACGNLTLLRLDPWRRITPRLARAEDASLRLGAPAAARARELAAELYALERRSNSGAAERVLVHGDFHVGQLLRPIGREDYALLDLDDLALGARESDIANLVAHLATSTPFPGHSPGAAIATLLPLFVAAYDRQSTAPLDDHLTELHCAIALLRRALKLDEHGEAGRTGDILDVIEALARNLRRAPATSRGVARASERGRRRTCAS